jgi:hypothetical protein
MTIEIPSSFKRDIVVCFFQLKGLIQTNSAGKMRNTQMKIHPYPMHTMPSPDEIAALRQQARQERAAAVRDFFKALFVRRKPAKSADTEKLSPVYC